MQCKEVWSRSIHASQMRSQRQRCPTTTSSLQKLAPSHLISEGYSIYLADIQGRWNMTGKLTGKLRTPVVLTEWEDIKRLRLQQIQKSLKISECHFLLFGVSVPFIQKALCSTMVAQICVHRQSVTGIARTISDIFRLRQFF